MLLDLGDTVAKMKNDFGVEDVMTWHAMAGYWAGVAPEAEEMQRFEPFIEELVAPEGIQQVDPQVRQVVFLDPEVRQVAFLLFVQLHLSAFCNVTLDVFRNMLQYMCFRCERFFIAHSDRFRPLALSLRIRGNACDDEPKDYTH